MLYEVITRPLFALLSPHQHLTLSSHKKICHPVITSYSIHYTKLYETSTEAVEVAVQDAQEADQDEIIKSLNARIEQLESKLSSENNSPLASVDSESIKLALFKTEELKNNIAKLNKEYEDLKNDLSKQGSETNSRILSLMDRNDNLKKELESQTSLSSETDKKITQEISMISRNNFV